MTGARGRKLLAALLLLATLLAAPRAWALPEETWVVTIGNNRGDADEVMLLYAERDARELGEVLRSEARVASDRVRLLINESADTVRRSLAEINAAIRQRSDSRPSALLVFYSGHADADALHLGGTRLPFDELRNLVVSSPAAMRLLIVDACRAGAVTRVKGASPAPEFAIRLEDRVEAEGVAIIASSTAGESSQESDRLRASFFSHHLINALRGAADRNGDGRITLSETYAYTYEQTLRSSGRTLTLQHPTYAYDLKGSGDLVLTTLAEAAGTQGSGLLRLGPAATYLLSDARESGVVVAELTPPRDGAVISLPRGRYFVQQRGSDEYREYQVNLGPGDHVDLQSLPFRSVRYDRLVRKGGGDRRVVHGLTLLGGGRGEVLSGEGATGHLVLGYQVDLPWLTAGLRLRGTTVSTTDGGLQRRHSELSLGLSLQRYVDLPWLSVSFGLLIEGIYHDQRFDQTARTAPGRTSLGMGFSALFALERQLWRGAALRIEGGPLALVYESSGVVNGVETASTLGSSVTWWLAGGLTWRF